MGGADPLGTGFRFGEDLEAPLGKTGGLVAFCFGGDLGADVRFGEDLVLVEVFDLGVRFGVVGCLPDGLGLVFFLPPFVGDFLAGAMMNKNPTNKQGWNNETDRL